MGFFKKKAGLKEFIENIARELVDNPNQVTIDEKQRDRMTVLELRVGDGDLGKVIGRQGQTAKALRTLLAAASARQGKKTTLEILE